MKLEGDIEFPEMLVNPDLAGCVDVFKCLMLKASDKSLLPEFIEVFGPELLVKFLTMFAGTTFTVPSRDVIAQLARDANIYRSVLEHREKKLPIVRIARQFQMPVENIYATYDRVLLAVEEYGIG